MGANINKIPTMLPERAAQIIIQQAAKRKRQCVTTTSGKTMFWIEKLAPSLAERILASVPINYEEQMHGFSVPATLTEQSSNKQRDSV